MWSDLLLSYLIALFHPCDCKVVMKLQNSKSGAVNTETGHVLYSEIMSNDSTQNYTRFCLKTTLK